MGGEEGSLAIVGASSSGCGKLLVPAFMLSENNIYFFSWVSPFIKVACDCSANVSWGIYGDKQFHSAVDLERLF